MRPDADSVPVGAVGVHEALVRLLDALTGRVIQPAVVGAADAALVGDAEEQPRPSMCAVRLDQPVTALAFAVEDAKIALSGKDRAALSLAFVDNGLATMAERVDFERAIEAKTARLYKTASDCIAAAGLSAAAVDTIFITGGSSRVPAVRTAIARAAPSARLAAGSDFLSVALGLTQMAAIRA